MKKRRSPLLIFAAIALFLSFLSPNMVFSIDASEEDLASRELFSEALTATDIDAGEKDIGQGEPLRKEDALIKDVDPKGKDLGQGEPFIKSVPKLGDQAPPQDTEVSFHEPAQTGDAEILLGSDFTNAILEGSVSEKPFLKSTNLLNEPSDDLSEIGFIQDAEAFNTGLNKPEEGFDPTTGASDEIHRGESGSLPEADALISIITVIPVP